MRRILLWSAVGLVGLVILLGGSLVLFGNDLLRYLVNSRGGAAIGRTLSVGDVSIQWSRPPRIILTDLKIGNVEWGSEPTMAELARGEISFRPLELLRGRVVLPEVILERPKLLIEMNQDGSRKNWDFSENPEAAAAKEVAAPDDRFEFPVIGRLVIREGRVRYVEPPRQIDLNSQVSTATGSGGEGSEMVELGGEGSFQGQPFRLDVKAGSLLMLRETSEPYPVEMRISIGETRAHVAGTMGDPIKLENLDLQLEIQGPDPAKLFPIIGIPVPSTPPYRIAGRLGKQGQVWRMEKFDGKVGDTDLTGSFSFDLGRERPFLKADLVSKKVDLDDFAGFIGATPGAGPGETASEEQRRRAAEKANDPRVLPDATIDLERLRAIDAEVTFKGAKIDAPGLPLDKVDLALKLDQGRLTLKPLNFGMSNGRVTSTVVLDGRQDVPATELDLQIVRVQLRPFFEGTRFATESDGEFAGRAKLAGRGRSVREVLASANGTASVIMGNGRFSNLLLEVAGLDIAEALGFLVGRDRSIRIRCMVADLAIERGVITPRAFIIDTTDTNIVLGGRVNLGTEELNLRLTAQPKDPSVLSARAPVNITGTLKNPTIRPDAAALAARGGAAVALGALLTPLAALIPFIELGLGEDNDCEALIAQANEKSGERPKPPPARNGRAPERQQNR